MVTMPMTTRKTLPGTSAEVAQPSAMPASAPGSMIFSVVQSPCLRQMTSDIMSMKIRIGSRMAAACTGETTRARKGNPISDKASPIPPFARPTRMTAGMAA